MDDFSIISSDSEDDLSILQDIEISKDQDLKYNNTIYLLNQIKDFRNLNNPLILDQMSHLNFFNFIDQINNSTLDE